VQLQILGVLELSFTYTRERLTVKLPTEVLQLRLDFGYVSDPRLRPDSI
jgi:hypothetical protein